MRVIARIDARNDASVRLAERLGMRREAHLIANVWFKGAWSDEIDLALLEDETDNSRTRVLPWRLASAPANCLRSATTRAGRCVWLAGRSRPARDRRPLPYIHVTLASGRPRQLKRELIVGLTDTMERVLEVRRSDIHVLLWELATENIGEGGAEPSNEVTNNITVVMSQGRPAEVVLVLISSLTDVVETVLAVARADVHLVVLEEPFTRIGEGGIPMDPPRVPHWYYRGSVRRHEY